MKQKYQWFGNETYAQHGDDLALLNIFVRLRIAYPSYIDVGAHHPFELSNTALIYARGGRGVNVDANPDVLPLFKLHRPEDINLTYGVGPEPGVMKFYRTGHAASGLNSFVRESVAPHGIKDTINVEVVTLQSIIDKHCGGVWPDLLTLDAEDMDLSILESVDFPKANPKVICVEAVSPLRGNLENEVRKLMTLHNGYFIHSWAGSNAILVRYELMEACL